MEGVVQGHGNERGWPDTVGRIHKKAAADASDTVADEVGTKSDQDLIRKGGSPALVEVVGQVLNPDC